MSEATRCPGCTNSKDPEAVCCSRCWESIPSSIPGLRRVRTTLRDCRRLSRWAQLEDALDILRAWLKQNYIRRDLPVIAAGSGDDSPYRTGTSR